LAGLAGGVAGGLLASLITANAVLRSDQIRTAQTMEEEGGQTFSPDLELRRSLIYRSD